MTARHCAPLQPRTRGLLTASSTIAASPRRSRVAPTAPVTGNRCVASAAPNWNDVHDPSTIRIAVPGRPAALASARRGAPRLLPPCPLPPPPWPPSLLPPSLLLPCPLPTGALRRDGAEPGDCGGAAGVAGVVIGGACCFAYLYSHRLLISSSSD